MLKIWPRFGTVLVTLKAIAFSGSIASAGTIPYANVGVENPQTYSFTVTQSGMLSAYSYKTSSAYLDELLGVLVNGVDSGVLGLDNHSSHAGDMLDFGLVNKGDKLTFFIQIPALGNQRYYSNPALNPGFYNQVYATPFGGDSVVPAGVYVAFEDLNPVVTGSSDFNYQDEEFVFAGAIASVPLPGSLPLLGLGLLVLCAGARSVGFGARRPPSSAF